MPDTTFHHRSYNHGYMTFGFPASYADHHSFNRYPHNPSYQPTSPAPPSTLPVQPGYVWDIRTCLRQSPAPPPMVPYLGPMSPRASEPVSARLTEQFYQPQLQNTWSPYAGTAPRITAPDPASETEDGLGPQAHDGLVPRELVPQEPYKTARRQRDLGCSQTIGFSVYGERGIRLSDALEENWLGLEDRDERTLFGDDRVQIMIRLHIAGCPPWRSKVYTTDHTVRRQPITRAKLAYEVAKSVRRFLEREKAEGHDDCSQCSWKDASLGNMYLTCLARVSSGSWQPEIFMG